MEGHSRDLLAPCKFAVPPSTGLSDQAARAAVFPASISPCLPISRCPASAEIVLPLLPACLALAIPLRHQVKCRVLLILAPDGFGQLAHVVGVDAGFVASARNGDVVNILGSGPAVGLRLDQHAVGREALRAVNRRGIAGR